MEQETSSNPSCSILLAVSSTLTAISFALGEYLMTTVLYTFFTSLSLCPNPYQQDWEEPLATSDSAKTAVKPVLVPRGMSGAPRVF